MLDEQIVEQLKVANAGVPLTMLTAQGESIVVRPVPRPAWKRFRAAVDGGTRMNDNLELLLLDCLVYPDRQAFTTLLERKPGLAETFGHRLAREAGYAAEVDAKKL
jgi:hypothetical protein